MNQTAACISLAVSKRLAEEMMKTCMKIEINKLLQLISRGASMDGMNGEDLGVAPW